MTIDQAMHRDEIVQRIRAFNRFYVDLIGLLTLDGYHSNYNLAETRILFEIQQIGNIQAKDIMLKIRIDKSYLSRILRRLEKDGLITRKRSDQDARAVTLSLTQKGKLEIEQINQAASDLVQVQIKGLDESSNQQLVRHMEGIVQILNTGV